MGPAGFVAVTAGWIVTESGRQPFTVYGLLRTADSASPVAAPAIATSLAAYAVVYTIVFGAGIWLILRLVARPVGAPDDRALNAPIRSAGITPAPALANATGREGPEQKP